MELPPGALYGEEHQNLSPIRARDGPISFAVPLWSCSLLPSALQLAGVESPPSASLSPSVRSLSVSRSVWPFSPHVMTLRLTHLGRGHIPYSAPRIYYLECATWHTHTRPCISSWGGLLVLPSGGDLTRCLGG